MPAKELTLENYKELCEKAAASLAFLEDIEGLSPKERGLSFEIPLENMEALDR